MKRLSAVKLCKALLRLENKAHIEATAGCNGYYFEGGPEVDGDEVNQKGDILAMKARAILGVTGTDSPFTFFFNGDARGYALKLSISKEAGQVNIHRDMGGFGIIAPDFRE